MSSSQRRRRNVTSSCNSRPTCWPTTAGTPAGRSSPTPPPSKPTLRPQTRPRRPWIALWNCRAKWRAAFPPSPGAHRRSSNAPCPPPSSRPPDRKRPHRRPPRARTRRIRWYRRRNFSNASSSAHDKKSSLCFFSPVFIGFYFSTKADRFSLQNERRNLWNRNKRSVCFCMVRVQLHYVFS